MTPSNERFLKIQFKRLTLLKAAPQEPEAIRSWAEALETTLLRIGEDRFSQAVKRCIEKLEYFPMPTVFREMIPPQRDTEQETREKIERREQIRAYQESEEGRRDLEEMKRSLRELGLKYGIGKSEETA